MPLPVQKQLAKLPKNYLILVLTPADGYLQAAIETVRHLVGSRNSVVYVSVNKPGAVVLEHLKRAGVRTDRVFFIDCATASVSGESQRTMNTLFVSPQNLTGLSLAINELLSELPGSKAIVFDSLDTLAVYNPVQTLRKFSHFIANKIRINNVGGMLLANGEADRNLITLMEEVCDETIRFKGGGRG